jgi:O-antigen/teichoic acid export membrane protein
MSSFKSKLLNGFAWRLCLYLSSFILNIFIAQSFGAEKSGVFYLLLNNLAFVVLLLSFGLESSVAYFNSRKEIPTHQLLSLSIFWSVFISVVLLVLYLTAVQLKLISAQELAPYLILNIFSSILANCLSSILFSSNDNSTPNLTLALINIGLILLLPGFPLAHFFSIQQDYTQQYLLLTASPSLIFIAYLFLKNIRFSFTKPSNFWIKKIIHFSLQSFAYSCLYALLLRCDYWLVNYFCSDHDLGNYLQTTKLSQIMLVIPTLVSFSLFPLIVSHIQQEINIENKLVKLISIYFYAGLCICIGLLLAGSFIFPWLYGPSFSKMYLTFILLSPGILFLAATYPLATFYSGKNLIRVKITALLFSILIIVVLDLLLIPWFNIYGAAIASSIAYCFYFTYLLLYFKKNHPFKLEEVLNIKRIIKENMPVFFANK